MKEKYADCCPRQYELQEKPVTKEFITQLISRAGSPNVENSWQMVFEACDKNRHIGVFISDDECALDFGKKRAISCRIKLATEMEIVLAAWDDDLLHQNNRERAKIISDGL